MRSLVITLITLTLVFGFHFVSNVNGDTVDNGQNHTLIDFNTFDQNVVDEYPYASYMAPGEASQVNPSLSIDAGGATSGDDNYVSPATPTEPVTDEGNFMQARHWRVVQNPSATMPVTMINSDVRTTTDTDGNNILGVKITFPASSYTSHAVIEPCFEFMPYVAEGDFTSPGADITLRRVDHDMAKMVGVIWNVGKVRSVSVDVCGRGFRNGLSVVLRDLTGEKHQYFMGYLDFIGWKRLEWVDDTYSPFVDPERVHTPPVYPIREPYMVFDSFIVHRYDGGYGHDFVVYFRNVKVNYDWSVPPSVLTNLGVNDDQWWDISKDTYIAQYKAMREYAEGKFRMYNDEIGRKGENWIPESNRETGEATATTPAGGGNG